MAVFAPLKQAYGDLVEQRMWNNYNHINKIDFLTAFFLHIRLFLSLKLFGMGFLLLD
jgi:hypothetical protein